MFRCLIALTFLATSAAVAAPAWTWVDANGRRHFSDRPVPGATQIALPESRPSAPPAQRETAQAADGGQPVDQQVAAQQEQPASAPSGYSRLEITSPYNDETLWNIGGTLTMQVDIAPTLHPNHSIDAILDGDRIVIGAKGAQLSIPDVYRGLHTLQAVIVDTATGREVQRSLGVTVMVQQTSVQNPNRNRAN